MNWYVLFVLTQYEDQICRYIKDSQIHIFSAKYEHYRRDKDCIEIKSLFPGYLFVKTNRNQMEFNDWLNKLNHRKGIIKQLSYTSISALKDEEIKIFDLLLDDMGVLRMSSGYFDNKKLVICSGPLVGFDDYIVKYDKRNKEARLLILSFIGYVFIIFIFIPSKILDMWFIFQLLFLAFCVTIFDLLLSRYSHIVLRPFFKKNVMIVGVGHTASALSITCRANRYSLMDVKCCIDCNDSKYMEVNQEYVIQNIEMYSVEEIQEAVKKHEIDTILVAIPEMSRKNTRELILRVQDLVKIVKYLPQVPNTINFDSKIEDFDGLLMISTATGQMKPWSKLMKRLLDIMASFCGLLLLIPITVFVYFKNRSQGDTDPIFFTQERIGKNGKTFKLYKFRTMVPNAEQVLEELMEQDPAIKQEYLTNKKLVNDPRITKAGAFLRKTSLDEFPQFINVLKGEMSLIGPRPYLLREKEDMGQYYKAIISCKPGLTGMWQTHGRSDVSFEYRLELDDYYYRNWSFWLDVTLFLKTIRQVLTGSGAM